MFPMKLKSRITDFMNASKKRLMVLFVFLILASSAYAQDYSLFSGKYYDLRQGQENIEFEFYNETYIICENDKKSIPILAVSNDAKTDNKLNLDATGVGWASLNLRQFPLPKSQSGVVFLGLNPSENTKGSYVVHVSGLSSIGNVRRDLMLAINVERCYSLKLALQESDKSCGGVKKQYKGEIANDGKEKIDAELLVSGPNWITMDKNRFSISPHSNEEFELNADMPSNAKGIFNVAVSAASKDIPSLKSEKKLAIEVVPKYECYRAEIIADSRIRNDYSGAYATIKIRNSGIKPANYGISLEAPAWISIEPKKLSVNPGQIGSLNLNINPAPEVQEGNYPLKINVKFEDITYSKDIEVVLTKNRFLKGAKAFFIFYQYYIYVIFIVAIILFVFRRQISNKAKNLYKNYKTRQARLKALETARKARQLKRQIKQLEQAKFEVKKINRYRRNWILFFAGLIIMASILFVSIYKYNLPVSKEFVKNYGSYLIAGILISLFIIFLIEFYKPLFKLLRKIK